MTAPSRQDRRRIRQSAQAVELRIDELMLHGVAQSDTATLTAALSEELSRLASQPAGLPASRTGRVVAPPYAPGAPAESGRAVASALWAGIRDQGARR